MHWRYIIPITHLPRMFLPSDLLWEHRNGIIRFEVPYIVFTPYWDILVGVFQALWMFIVVVFGPWINHMPLVSWSIFGKSVLNKMVCKFNRMDDNVLYYVNIYINSTWYYILPPQYLKVCLIIFIFSSDITFVLTWVLCPFISHRSDPYSS